MMKEKRHIKKDDKVKIIAGKDKGKIGKVLKVISKKNRVLVENINLVKHHTKPNAQNRQGGIIESEAPIHWSNVMLMCNKCMSSSRIKMRHLEDGRNVRVCAKCDEIIDA
ncbi:50S ribosomal protein L24 [Desulfonema ishimotonii]|uniref:Large ribosomal subunit protein uL24 n=1 Tax=Desulfonema ishimotonii TaxID=45657 RepID=A0A401G0D8_9BACT|nr:50S ribosomal protein L24 [Desulfonema ishimotonii]GBC62656.1 50S ribosomal protein L24 [Desulfonema ishimotonii]